MAIATGYVWTVIQRPRATQMQSRFGLRCGAVVTRAIRDEAYDCLWVNTGGSFDVRSASSLQREQKVQQLQGLQSKPRLTKFRLLVRVLLDRTPLLTFTAAQQPNMDQLAACFAP